MTSDLEIEGLGDAKPIRKRKLCNTKYRSNGQIFRDILIEAFDNEEVEKEIKIYSLEDNWKL